MRSDARLGFGVLFFLSGATGLVYELLWVRVLYQTFGSTIQSVTTVVAAFMGGLGLGAWLFGRRADSHARPAALYGWLEIAIAVCGILSPALLALVHWIYLVLAGGLGLGGAASVALRFGLAAVVLAVPATLMGGTLPVLTRAFTGERRQELQASVGRLYGVNTLGAVTGTALAGFVLIEYVGISAAIWGTAAVNLAIGVAAIALARRAPAIPPVPSVSAVSSAPSRDALTTTALILLGVTAFASLLDEIAWTRVLVMVVGGSTYAFTLILAVFLLGIGIGSALVAGRAGARLETTAQAALAQGITAAGAAVLFLFFTALPVYVIAVFQVLFLDAIDRLMLLGLAVGAVVLVPAIGMGMTFPLLVDLVARPDAPRGGDVGRAYALNTIGSIAGAALTGFVLVATLGTDLTLRVGLVVSGIAALTLAVFAAHGAGADPERRARVRLRTHAAGALAAIGIVSAVSAPRWSTRLVDLGPTIYARAPMNATGLEAYLQHRGVRQLDYREGRNATVSVWESEAGRSLKVNGKADASDRGDMDTQVMLGLAPAVARAGATSAFVIGHGSGVTARVLAAVPGMTRVRIVELEPAVLAMDRFFTHVNDSVLSRPNVHVTVDDARSALQLSRETFDVIVSEPSNPWVAGIATLYTPEFFRVVRSRLAADGVFSQWIQLYQLPLPVMAGIIRSIRDVFPYVQVWFGSPADVMVLASPVPFREDAAWRASLLGPGGALTGVARAWLGLESPDDFAGRFLFADSGVARLVATADLRHTDDHPRLEYVAARRFLDSEGTRGVLDSLIAIGRAVKEGASPEQLAAAFAVRRVDARGLGYIDAVRRARPRENVWVVRTAAARLGMDDTLFADTALARVVREEPRRFPDAYLVLGTIAAARRQDERAGSLLAAALDLGADTSVALGTRAHVAARARRWDAVAADIRGAVAATRPSLARSFPYADVGDALTLLATEGPPAVADSVATEVVAWRTGWSRANAIRATAALRAGRCDAAADAFLALLDFGIRRPDGPGLVAECRRGSSSRQDPR
jgi:predicted membrane-bound spermidine synthase